MNKTKNYIINQIVAKLSYRSTSYLTINYIILAFLVLQLLASLMGRATVSLTFLQSWLTSNNYVKKREKS